jgi:hydrophobe/amphiphile efflux-3 (HAE3) family protein
MPEPARTFSLVPALVARRRLVWVLIALVTAVLGWHALTLRIDPGVESMIPTGRGDLEALRTFHARFGSDEVVVLALHSDRLFSRESLERIDRLTQRVSALPHVAQVLSPTNVRDLDGDELGPVPVVAYQEVQAGKLQPEAMGQRLGSHPIFGGLLVASDARTAAMLVELEPPAGSSGSNRDLVADLRRLASEAGPGITAFVAGIPVEQVDVATYIARDQKIFVPLVFLILAVMTAMLYRHPIGVLVPLGVLTLALVWALGLFGLAGRSLNPVTSLMTPVILVMSLEAAIQLLNQYLAARARGLTRLAALEQADRRMRIPCFNAALTAAIGFLSLLALPIPAIRDFGLFTAVGIMLGYALTIVVTPLLLASLPDFPPRVVRAFEPGPVERGLSRVVRWVCDHPAATGLGVGAILVLSAMGVARIRVETDLIRSLRHASPLSAAARFIDEHLTGVNSVEIIVDAVPVTDPAALEKVARFEDAVRGLHNVRKVTGLPDVVARVNRAVHRGDDTYAHLPDGPDAASDLEDFLARLSEEAPADLRRFMARGGDDRSTLRIIARVPALDSASSQALFSEIRDAAGRAGLPNVTLTGNFVVFSNMSTTLVRHQAYGLGVALILILGVMAIQFRSIRLGLLCAIPNGAPVLAVYGLMGWSGVALSVPTAMIASVAIGSIVDNSIYLLARFREAFAQQPDYVEALIAMVYASGRAVVFSTLTLAVGFFVGVFSSFVPTVHFGLLTGAAFLLGLISQFVLLPLSLILFQPLGRLRPAAALGSLLAVVVLVTGATAGPALAQETQGGLLLKDQFGNVDGPPRHRGQPVLLIYGKVEGMRRMKAWEERLRDKVPGALVVLRGLDAREAQGKKTETEVNERLQLNVPRDIAILVDWKGELSRAYGLPDANVSTTILDAQGKSCHTASGPVTPEALEQVRRVLVRARETGACP